MSKLVSCALIVLALFAGADALALEGAATRAQDRQTREEQQQAERDRKQAERERKEREKESRKEPGTRCARWKRGKA